MDPHAHSDPQRADSDPLTDSFRALNQEFQLTSDHIEEFRQLCLAEGSAQEVLNFLSVIADHRSPASIADSEWNTFLHMACQGGKIKVVEVLIEVHRCKVDSTNIHGRTPLHFACKGGHSVVVDKLVSTYGADLKVKDKKNNEPLHIAARNGHARLIISTLISKYHCDPTSVGQNGQNLLHLSLKKGHKHLAETLLKSFGNILSIGSIDNDGNTPLHLALHSGQRECVEMLLHRYNAPIFVENKKGKTARDLSKSGYWPIFEQYLDNPQSRVLQSTNEELHLLSLRKYSSQMITRVFVVGNSESGKSTLIEAFKQKGPLNSRFLVKAVAPKTPGIVPSHYDSRRIGRIIYYDFAGDREYYSSHSAIIEMVFQSQGNDFFFIVLDLCKDIKELKKQLGYWLSFISYLHKQNAAHYQSKIRAFLICSHADMLDTQVAQEKVERLKELLTEFKQSNDLIEIKHIAQINCRLPQDVRALKEHIQKEAKDVVPCCLSYEATLLHGVLEKNFSNVIACKLKDVMDHTINNTHIQLPSEASKIYTITRELQNAGLLLIIGRSEDQFEDYLLLMDIKSLTSEVHKKLFSEKARDNLISLPAKMGILPEVCLCDILELPPHITKECLVQLQYCHEFSRVEVKCNDHTVVPSISSNDNLLYFPDLCKLETASPGILNPNPGHLNIGWYAKCIGKFDYFPPRFLHTLLLRLAYSFALHITADKEESQLHLSVRQDNRRCTMWKNGICWRMEEEVVCFCEVVDDCKGIVVITQANKSNNKLITVLRQIIHKVLLTKAQYCTIISLQHFLLNSADPHAYQNEDELYDINDIENVIRQSDTKRNVVSVGGNKFLDSSHHSILRILSQRCTYWGK